MSTPILVVPRDTNFFPPMDRVVQSESIQYNRVKNLYFVSKCIIKSIKVKSKYHARSFNGASLFSLGYDTGQLKVVPGC